jgi:rsbT co-antagonist protein RsbR
MSSDHERRIQELEAENEKLRKQVDARSKVAARALASYQQRTLHMEIIRQQNEDLDRLANDLAGAKAAEEERSRELADKLATIEQQRTAIRDLSTPVMEVWDGILCLPIIGIMDSSRSADMTDALLRAVVRTRARATIIDITGIEVMDTHTADHFIRMAKSVRLLGAECVLTGIHPQIAQTVIHMGLNMSDLVSHRSLRDALQHFIKSRPASGQFLRSPSNANSKR